MVECFDLNKKSQLEDEKMNAKEESYAINYEKEIEATLDRVIDNQEEKRKKNGQRDIVSYFLSLSKKIVRDHLNELRGYTQSQSQENRRNKRRKSWKPKPMKKSMRK